MRIIRDLQDHQGSARSPDISTTATVQQHRLGPARTQWNSKITSYHEDHQRSWRRPGTMTIISDHYDHKESWWYNAQGSFRSPGIRIAISRDKQDHQGSARSPRIGKITRDHQYSQGKAISLMTCTITVEFEDHQWSWRSPGIMKNITYA